MGWVEDVCLRARDVAWHGGFQPHAPQQQAADGAAGMLSLRVGLPLEEHGFLEADALMLLEVDW